MSTLRQLKDEGCEITLYCSTTIGLCSHSWKPAWDQLIQYLGGDFDLAGDRSAMQRLRCEKCGSRGATVICVPAHNPGTQGVGGWRHTTPSTEVLESLHQADARVRSGMEAQIAASAVARRELVAERKAKKAVESGRDLIGPPNPWALRKRGRWL